MTIDDEDLVQAHGLLLAVSSWLPRRLVDATGSVAASIVARSYGFYRGSVDFTRTIATIDPFHRNVAACALMVLSFKGALEAVHWLRHKQILGRDASRAILQLVQSTAALWIAAFDSSHWTWRSGALVPAALAARWIYKGAFVKDPEDAEVQALSRSSAPGELLGGPLHAVAILVWLILHRFHQPDEAALVAAAIAVTDGWAPLLLGGGSGSGSGTGSGTGGAGAALTGLSGRGGSGSGGRLRGWAASRAGGIPHLLAATRTFTTVWGIAAFCGRTYQWSAARFGSAGAPPAPFRLSIVHGGIVATVRAVVPPGWDTLAVPAALLFLAPRLPEWLPPGR